MGSVSPDSESGRPGRLPVRSPDVQGHQTPAPPPAPPPPPPPPPPLMPPLLPGSGAPGVGQKKRRVRSFFWKTIPEHQVKGRANLWTQGGVRRQYQIDVRTVEELFGQSEGRPDAAAPPGRGAKARGSFREAKEEVSILDSKRGMNLGIFLKQFKRPNHTIIDDLHHGNSEAFGAEPLRELLKLLPEAEEVTRLRSYHGDVAKLPLADSFMHALVQLPSYRLRIESMLLKEEFPAAAEAMRRDVQILRSAAKELMCCDELHAVLHLVLQAGNILNAGGYAGGAVGFKLSSLLSLADTKANKPGMNLLHFVALEAQKKDQKLLDFPLKLRHVQAASRISVETLDAELQWLTSRTRSVEDSVRGDGELLQQLDHFLQRSAAALGALRGGRQQLQQEGGELLDFFCEDRDSFRLDDCFSVFHSFCSRFTQAVKENTEREAKEAARRRRVQELEEQKRHSWAGGEKVGGAFGFRCSSETDMSTTASRREEAGLLVELLAAKPRPRSPMNTSHGALGRSGSLRRSRNSPSSSPGAAAERELNAFLETSAFDRNVAKAAAPSPQPGLCNANQTTAACLRKDSASDSNQQCDQRNNGDKGVGVASATPLNSSSAPNEATDGGGDRESPPGAATAERLSMLVERCTLVPELRRFEIDSQPLSVNKVRWDNPRRDNLTISDLDGEKSDQSGTPEARLAESSSSSQREEDEGQNEEAVVWCVAGVCESNEDVGAQREREERPPSSSASARHAPSETPPANAKPVPVPISSQPVPVARGDNTSLPASPPEWCPAERPAERPSQDDTPPGEEEAARDDSATLPERSTDETPPRESSGAKVAASSKTIIRNLPTSKSGLSGVKPGASDAFPTGRSKSVRTLTSSERQGLRRVVPISRNSRGAPPAAAAALHGVRPATAPSSRRSSVQKTPDLKSPRTGVAPGTRAPPPERNSDWRRKTSVGRTRTEVEAEEKMCRSALRALSHARGGSVSAPATPLHRAAAAATVTTPLLPGFARSTAASSFRQTRTTPPAPSPSSSTSSSSTQPRRTQSTRESLRPPPRDSLAPPKGHRRNDSGSFSDKCVPPRDWARTARPSWR